MITLRVMIQNNEDSIEVEVARGHSDSDEVENLMSNLIMNAIHQISKSAASGPPRMQVRENEREQS